MTHHVYTRLLAAAGGLGAAAVMLLAVPGTAQASPAAPLYRSSHASPPSRSAHQVGRVPAAKAGKPGADVRRVCATPKKGYAACMALLRTNVKPRKGRFAPDQAPFGYGAADLQSAYNLPSATAGKGETVAVIDAYDDPTAEADLAVYRAQYGLPPCTTANGCFAKVNENGQAAPLPPTAGGTAGGSGWDVEESLDIDMVSAACPNCHILLVEANSNADIDLDMAVDEAVALGAKYVSNSYSGSEYSGETQEDQYFNHPGVAITASAGDGGYGVNYPAASPYVTAVGGTSLTRDPGSPRGWTESVYDTNDIEGTGSGCSAYEPKPSWQTDSGCANRTVADVSADADPNTGVAIYDSYSAGGWNEVGGTSVASPLVAATYALAGTPAAGSYPASYPYANPTALNDVTAGTNAGYGCVSAYLCTAGPGYDGPTGLGTPDGVAAFASPHHGPQHTVTISGKVTDGSGQGWPLSAAITASGIPGTVYTNPATGTYSLKVPPSEAYTLTVTPVASGYQITQQKVTVGTSNVTQNIAVAAGAGCDSLGYTQEGASEQFSWPTGPTPQDGWTVTDNNGSGYVWEFGNDPDPLGEGEPPGSDGNFAVVDSIPGFFPVVVDTSLISPVVNLSNVSSPVISFDTWYAEYGTPPESADVDLSLDGGQTWTTVWQQTTSSVRGPVDIPIPQAAGQSNVQMRFTYNGDNDNWWSLDNVLIGSCSPAPGGGLIAGQVKDAATEQPLAGATVTDTAAPAAAAATAFPEGAYEVYSPVTGQQKVTATDTGYSTGHKTVTVTAGGVTQANFSLKMPSAGELSFSSPSPSGTLSGTVGLGKSVTEDLTVTNLGNATASFALTPQDGSFTTTAKPATGITMTEPAGVGWVAASPAQGSVPPGGSVTVAVTLASGAAAGAAQPGAYTAGLAVSSDSPYPVAGVPVTMTVRPPSTWGEVTGAISGAACGGPVTALSGATAELTTKTVDDSLVTDTHSRYAWWLKAPENPLTVIASLNGWAPQLQKVTVSPGQATAANFTLQPSQSCNSTRR